MIGLSKKNAIGLFAALTLCSAGGTAVAQSKDDKAAPPPAAKALTNDADCTIFEIEATNAAPTVDPALKPLAKKLRKAPFSSWKTFKLLKKHDKRITKMKALRLPLMTGSKLTLLYRDRSGGVQNKVRMRLKFTLDDKNDKRKLDSTINVDSGDHSLIGGDELPGGATYILGTSCRAL